MKKIFLILILLPAIGYAPAGEYAYLQSAGGFIDRAGQQLGHTVIRERERISDNNATPGNAGYFPQLSLSSAIPAR